MPRPAAPSTNDTTDNATDDASAGGATAGSASEPSDHRTQHSRRSRRTRRTPTGAERILGGYALTVLALACGLPAVVIGMVGADHCDAEGFACLGWLVYGVLAAGLIAVGVLLALAVRFKLGLGFWLVYLVIVVAAVALQHDAPYAIGAGLLGPGVAAWLTDPRPADRHPMRHWGPRLVVLVVVVAVAPLVIAAGSS